MGDHRTVVTKDTRKVHSNSHLQALLSRPRRVLEKNQKQTEGGRSLPCGAAWGRRVNTAVKKAWSLDWNFFFFRGKSIEQLGEKQQKLSPIAYVWRLTVAGERKQKKKITFVCGWEADNCTGSRPARKGRATEKVPLSRWGDRGSLRLRMKQDNGEQNSVLSTGSQHGVTRVWEVPLGEGKQSKRLWGAGSQGSLKLRGRYGQPAQQQSPKRANI